MATVAVDFDGVIHSYEHGWQDGSIYGDLIDGAMAGLTTLMQQHAVFVHTTRRPKQVAHWIEQRSGHGIECVTRVSPWPWRWGGPFWNERGVLLVTRRKYPAIAYLDDRALPFSTWEQALRALDVQAGDP